MVIILKKLKMEFEKLKIDGLVLCKPKIIEDDRGFFAETFRKDLLEDFISEKLDFCQHNTSKSSFGVLRGLHFQTKPKAQTKLVSVSNGEILDVVLDLRKDSPSFGKHYSIILNDINNAKIVKICFILLSLYNICNYLLFTSFNVFYSSWLTCWLP